MSSHHHLPLTIYTKLTVKCCPSDFCACYRFAGRASGVTTTRRVLRHVADRAHRDSSVTFAALSVRIQAANAAILDQCTAFLFARLGWRQDAPVCDHCYKRFMQKSILQNHVYCAHLGVQTLVPTHIRQVWRRWQKSLWNKFRIKIMFTVLLTSSVSSVTFTSTLSRWRHILKQ